MFLFGTVLCGTAPSLDLLILGRVFEGLGACAGIVLARAIIRDVYEREAAARGLALVMMAMTLAPAISPAFGAYLSEWIDWRAIFLLLGGLGAIVFAATLARLGETNRNRTRLDLAGMVAAYGLLLRSPAFVGFALCSACCSASWFTFLASAPHLLADIVGEPPSTYGLMILMPMGTYMLGIAIAARFAFRFGSLTLLICGRVVAFVGATVMILRFLVGGVGIWAMFLTDRLYRDRRRKEPAIDDGGRPKYPYSACWHRVAADGLFADGDGRRRELYHRPFSAGQRVRSDLGFAAFVVLALAFGLFAVRR